MLRKVGRIILLGVSIAMIVFAIMDIIKDIDGIKELINKYKEAGSIAKDLSGIKAIIEMFKQDLSSDQTRQLLINFGLQCLTAIAAVCGILAAIFNRGGFWFTIISAILLVLLITDIVGKAKAGSFATDKLKDTLLQLFKDVGLQIGYVCGFLILKLTPKE